MISDVRLKAEFIPQEGNRILFHTAEGGINQVRALVSLDGHVKEKFYKWNEDENQQTGFKKKGDLKAFGVCDEQWQIELRNCAKSYLGSTEYALGADLNGLYEFSSINDGDWKCNYFVSYRIREIGLSLLPQRSIYWRKYPPLANDWSGNADTSNWERITENIYIQPGFVVGHPAFLGSGHCGILDFDGAGIAAGEFIVNRRYKKWLDGTSGFRRYTNE